MAPEYYYGNLAVLDLHFEGSELRCDVDLLEMIPGVTLPLYVSWNATACPSGAEPFGRGAVFVWRPDGGYRRRQYTTKPDDLDGGHSWIHPIQGQGLMLIMTLPQGYVLPSVDSASPDVARSKLLDAGRMAVFWMLTGGERAHVSWRMEPIGSIDLERHVGALNREATSRHPHVSQLGEISPGVHQPGPPIFLIHGHDEAAVVELKKLFEEMGGEGLVVMKDRHLPGVTLTEKFERLAGNAGLALAVLTPDDVGGAVDRGEMSSRARQNVWLEIGWFWGRLGRDHVLLVMRGEVEWPSDLRGLDHEQYRTSIRELEPRIRAFLEAHGVRIPGRDGTNSP